MRELTAKTRTIGLILPTLPQGADPNWDIGKIASSGEELGADVLWVCDHLAWHSPVIECFTALAIAANSTRNCLVGSGVLQLPLRPTQLVAKTAASLQMVSNGRLILGVGVGVHEGEYDALEVGFHERGKRVEQAIDQLRTIWSTGTASDRETRYKQLPVPGEIPIWIGGSSEYSLSRAARLGDGWMPLFVPPEKLARQIGELDDQAVALGRQPFEITKSIVLFVSTDSKMSSTSIKSRGIDWMGSLYRLDPEKFSRHIVSGSPQECAQVIQEYYEVGVNHVVVYVTSDHPLDQFAQIQEALGNFPIHLDQ